MITTNKDRQDFLRTAITLASGARTLEDLAKANEIALKVSGGNEETCSLMDRYGLVSAKAYRRIVG
jgi:hypothetical protein